MAEVGRQIFSDTALSVSGKQSCATCHVADHAFAAADGRSVPLGGPHMDLPGLRATPSLMYASYAPAFKFASDGTPTGGFFRDGRSPTLADQAQQPFVTSFEMANADAAAVLQKLLTRPYLDQFEAVFGASVVSDPKQALASMGAALAAFQTEDVSFHPFTSKFDAYEAGTTTLTAAELQGLALFNDPTKGNCNACHVSTGSNNVRALFTDFTYDSIGLPRNWKIAANQAASALPYVPANGAQFAPAPYAYYDLGLCGPLRPDLDYRLSLCGAFKVPTLRNVAVKQNYFHNAAYDNLVDAVTWYATRDTNPTRWYRTEDGGIDGAFNDLPASLQGSINRDEVPYNPVTAPTLTSNDIELIVTFLCTLTDGYDPKQPASYRVPSQCQQAAAAARP
ncbi:MAG: diacylglycerol kinase [Proteobacteria bacterium]|nr:diacylglycerol kinase [Pseudomonadota bacterium]